MKHAILMVVTLNLGIVHATAQCVPGQPCDDADTCTANDVFAVLLNGTPTCLNGTVEFPQPVVNSSSGALSLADQRIVSPFLHELPVARRFRKQFLWRAAELDVQLNQLAGNADVTSGLGTCEPVNAVAFHIDMPVSATDQRFWQVTMTLKHAPAGMEELAGGFANNVDTAQGCGSENAVLFPPVNPQPGWASFPLSNPFQWDGVRGVILEVAATLAGGPASAAPFPVRYDQAVPPADQVTYYAYAEAPFGGPCTPVVGMGECSTVNIATALSSACGTFGSSALRPAVRFSGGVDEALPASCVCAGTVVDSDADSIPDCMDMCPFGPNPGEFCDDADPSTIGDVVQEDCSCSGIPLSVPDASSGEQAPFRVDLASGLLHFMDGAFTGELIDPSGRSVRTLSKVATLDLSKLPAGVHVLRRATGGAWRLPVN